MRLIYRVMAFLLHAILSRMFYQPVSRACLFIPWQVALKSYYSYTSILSEWSVGQGAILTLIRYFIKSGLGPVQTGPDHPS